MDNRKNCGIFTSLRVHSIYSRTVVLISIISLISCTNQRKNSSGDSDSVKPYPHIINIAEGFQNKTQLKLSDIADSIRYIVLSKNKEILIGDVQNIQMSDSNIYIKSNNLVLRFDFSGNLLNSFGNIGRGPEEYLPGSPYTLSPDFDKVMILKNMMYEYLIYKPDGDYIGKKELPHPRNLFNFVNLADSTFMMTFYYIGSFMTEDYLKSMPGIAGLFDSKCQPIAIIENPLKNTKISKDDYKRIAISNPSFTFFDNRIVLTPDGDTIFEIDDNSIRPGFIFDWGQLPHRESIEELYYRQTESSGKITAYKPVLETSTKAFFRGNSGKNLYIFEYNKTTGLSRSMEVGENNSGFINDLDGGADYFPYWTNRAGDIWIVNEDAYNFKEKQSEEFLSNSVAINPARKEKLHNFLTDLKIDDNPVLKIVYLKKYSEKKSRVSVSPF
jgi:hypothetical protein